ncbi:hypothetical protein BLGI_2410 [Brevibacillus laterosporus GI-9]|nr:hypothetical protein BLGI_2410 [Brevibacillus laterosporus GI-9]
MQKNVLKDQVQAGLKVILGIRLFSQFDKQIPAVQQMRYKI